MNSCLALDKLDLILRLALGVEVGVEVHGRHAGKGGRDVLVMCILSVVYIE